MRIRIVLVALAAALSASCEIAPTPQGPPASQALSGDIHPEAEQLAKPILDRLDAAWNAASGSGFAAEFTDDADVINIFGTRIHGREAIAQRMQTIFDGLFKGSVHRSRTMEIARHIAPDTILIVSSSHIEVASGAPSLDMRNSRQTFLLVDDQGAWRIRHWHNTTIETPPARP